ncbi:hypothetical protein EVAR_6262_1 [Eumeta japonica]|uniref:Uncharacterized protein n=1 Tax=Eumeta variegata TaxID=151549 RepID=A0A4C1TB78_EUMVA|nr:hypothetical protein EVAR_6262_1 [Eumeta japonica]
MLRWSVDLKRINGRTLTKQIYRANVCGGKVGEGRPRKSYSNQIGLPTTSSPMPLHCPGSTSRRVPREPERSDLKLTQIKNSFAYRPWWSEIDHAQNFWTNAPSVPEFLFLPGGRDSTVKNVDFGS